MQKISRPIMFFAGMIFLLPIFGCGESGLNGLYPVKGTLTHKGTPMAGVSISLMPVNPQPGTRAATAVSGADGSFVVRTLKPDDGAFPGGYKITLTKLVCSMSKAEMEAKNAKNIPYSYTSANIMPKKYQDVETTNLTYTVQKKNPPLVIDIAEDLVVPPYEWYREELKKQK